jgi:Fur family ferric uptake transcriptional regulator
MSLILMFILACERLDSVPWPLLKLSAMSVPEAERWAVRAQQALGGGRRHSGGARTALVELLDSQLCALSALEIEDALRAQGRPVGRASIYRILDELERLRLVQRLQVGQAMARYEPIRPDEHHHHHLVCDTCGTVTPFRDSELERAIEHLSERVELRVDEHEIVLHGSCPDCSG